MSERGQDRPKDDSKERHLLGKEPRKATAIVRVISRYKNDTTYRRKIHLSIFVGYLAFTLGWVKGLVGPSFPDLLQITGTDLERGSAFITSFYVGRIVGSMSGVLYDRCNKPLFLTAVCMANGITVAVIPWCSVFELMVAVYLLHGAFSAAMDVGSTAASFSVWGRNSIVFYQAYHFILSIGGILSPLAVAPFLVRTALRGHDISDHSKDILDILNLTSHDPNEIMLNVTDMGQQILNNSTFVQPDNVAIYSGDSILFIAYFIAAFLVFIAGVPFIFVCKSPLESEDEEEETTHSSELINTKYHRTSSKPIDNYRNIPRYFAIVNTCVFSGLYTAVELGMGNFLTVFCLRHMKWSKLDSVFAVSIFYTLFMIGRLFGIVIVKFIKSLKLLLLCMLMTLASFSAFLACAYLRYDAGVWVCTGLAGFAVSTLFPTAISWTNKAIAPVLGTVATLIIVTAYVGPFINPPLLSFLMETYDYMWFCYVLLMESGLMFLTYLGMVWYDRRRKRDEVARRIPEEDELDMTS